MATSKKKNCINVDLNKIDIPKNLKFSLSEKDMGLSNELRTFGFREPINSREYYNFLSKEDIVLDIGSNLGYFALLATRAKKIICIEPLEECIPILTKNLNDEEKIRNYKIINKAVGKKKHMYIEKNKKLNQSRVFDRCNEYTKKVKSETLDYFIKKFKANVLRMDLEGYEYDLLYKKIPEKVTKISLEYHTNFLGRKKTKRFMEYMEKEGFIVKSFTECLPLRLYPFYGILKKTGLIKKFTYVKKNIKPTESLKYLFEGRSVNHINFERKTWKEKR
jgi:FkbM family methyltransferase